MLRSILVGLDGSEYAAAAANLAVEWSRRHDALLVGLGIIDEPGIRQPSMMPLGGASFKERRDQACLAHARRSVEQFLERCALQCAQEKVSCKLLEEVGDPVEQIVEEAQRYDLILLGKQTHFRFATQEEPCDTLHQVLKNSPRPVVAVPNALGDGSTTVIAYDGSLQAARSVQALVACGLAPAYPVHVVTIHTDHVKGNRHAQRVLEYLDQHGVRAVPHVVSPREGVARTLLDKAAELQARLLVMGAYGQPVLKEFFLGSVTRTLMKDSGIPLFLYH